MASSAPSWAVNADAYGSNDSFLLLDIFPKEVADDLFYNLQKEIKWNTMRQKGKRVPREISIQGSITIENNDEYEPLYRHPADEQPELVSWTPTALRIKERIEEVIQQKINHALIQYYKTGKDNIGEHSDKTLDILLRSNIVNYSLGAARTMTLLKKGQYNIRQDFKLPHNSLFVLGWKTNREWHHCIRPDKRPISEKSPDELAFYGERISLTLRTVATFLNRRTGYIYGQGARHKTLQENFVDEYDNDNDDMQMVHAFSAENHQSSEFDWNYHYGRGFNALNFKVLNSHHNKGRK
jgi:alkylated DNA repair dioxygenase AlkB